MGHRNKTKANGSHATQIQPREQANMPAPKEESPRLMDHPMSWMRNEMESMFERFFGRPWTPMEEGSGRFDRFWNVDVEDTDREIVVRAEAPGFDAKDFNIHVSGNLLTIEAEHKQESEEKKGEYRSWERRYGRF